MIAIGWSENQQIIGSVSESDKHMTRDTTEPWGVMWREPPGWYSATKQWIREETHGKNATQTIAETIQELDFRIRELQDLTK